MGMIFGEVVYPVLSNRTPENVKVPLSYAITNPIISHIDYFWSSLLYCFVSNLTSALVVGGDGSQRSSMAQVL